MTMTSNRYPFPMISAAARLRTPFFNICYGAALTALLIAMPAEDCQAFPQESGDKKAADEAPDKRIGKKVIVTAAGAPLRTPEAIVWKAYLGETFTVALTNGEWLWISEKGGWLWEQQAVMFDDAISEFTKKIKTEPTAENYHLRGIAHSAHGQYEKAIADFTESLKLQSGAAGVLNNRGQAYYLQKKYDKAIADFDAAVNADRKHFVALNNRALCYIAKEDFDAAMKDLNTAIRQNKEYPEALNNRGVVYSKQGKYGPAITDFTQALKIDDKYIDAYGNRSFAYRQQDRFELAIADLRTAMEKNPLDFKPINDLAWVLATSTESSVKKPKEAVELATKACQMTSYEDWNCLDTLAAAYAADSDFKNALQWIATAVEKAPEADKPALIERQKAFEAEQPTAQ